MAGSVLNAPEGFEWVQRLARWQIEGSRLATVGQLSGGGEVEIIFTCAGEHAWRMQVQTQPGPARPLPLLADQPQPLPLQATEQDDRLVVTAGGTILQIEKEPWCLAICQPGGQVICRENPYDVDGLNRLFILPLGFVRRRDDTVACMTESFHLNPDEHLFGLGEKFTPLDKVGQKLTSWTLDALGAASERSYKNVPLLLSTAGYGVFLNTGYRCSFDLGAQSCETYTLTVDGPNLDLFLLTGPTLADLLQEYTRLTGRAPLPPKWSFGVWISGSGVYRDQAAIRQLVAGIEANDLPCDVIHIDPWWMRWRKYADFEWDRQAFPDPQGLLEELHGKGLRLSVWQHPYISIESDLYATGREKNYFVRRPDGEVYIIDYGLSLSTLPGGVTQVADESSSWNARVSIIDLTNPAATAWYKELMRPPLRMGLDVYKTDFGEDIPADACFSNGMTGAEMHNLYPLYYNQVVYEVTQEVKGQGLVWARSGWAGSQRYPTCWSGDPACTWDSLAFTLRGGLSLGLSGVPFWSHDVGGYRGHPGEGLYIRWAQFGMFTAHTRCHGESRREPWAFGERAVEVFRRYALLRYALFPYLYSCAHEATRRGMPVLRAMPLAFPGDPNTYDKDLQYLFGPAFLVAPVYNESGRRSVYLPAGKWVDYWTEETFEGPDNLEITVPLDRLPLYVRAGAVIPRMQPANRIPQGKIDPLILDIYPSGEFAYELLEDEGSTQIQGHAGEAGLELSWQGPVERQVIVQVHQDWAPAAVLCQISGRRAKLAWEMPSGNLLRFPVPSAASARIWVDR